MFIEGNKMLVSKTFSGKPNMPKCVEVSGLDYFVRPSGNNITEFPSRAVTANHNAITEGSMVWKIETAIP